MFHTVTYIYLMIYINISPTSSEFLKHMVKLITFLRIILFTNKVDNNVSDFDTFEIYYIYITLHNI